jgi:hypothetical protein
VREAPAPTELFTKCVEGEFSEVELRRHGVLRSSPRIHREFIAATYTVLYWGQPA